jgi:predicted nucleic acid-binding protein
MVGDGSMTDGMMTMLVVDASVAVKFVVREKNSELARELLREPDPLIAPDWLLVEAASALWKKVKRAELLIIHAERNLDALPDFFERLSPTRGLIEDAFRWSFRLRHPVYDCVYLSLALAERCQLVTADQKFHAALERGGFTDTVRFLGAEPGQ